jgi:hypothetical protein
VTAREPAAATAPITQHSPVPDDRAGASRDQIEVTPGMLKAGLEIYLGHCPDTGVGDDLDRRMIKEIFTAMICAGPACRDRLPAA